LDAKEFTKRAFDAHVLDLGLWNTLNMLVKNHGLPTVLLHLSALKMFWSNEDE